MLKGGNKNDGENLSHHEIRWSLELGHGNSANRSRDYIGNIFNCQWSKITEKEI